MLSDVEGADRGNNARPTLPTYLRSFFASQQLPKAFFQRTSHHAYQKWLYHLGTACGVSSDSLLLLTIIIVLFFVRITSSNDATMLA